VLLNERTSLLKGSIVFKGSWVLVSALIQTMKTELFVVIVFHIPQLVETEFIEYLSLLFGLLFSRILVSYIALPPKPNGQFLPLLC
jgi:hypothetical protein